jgi:VWFA-related protein
MAWRFTLVCLLLGVASASGQQPSSEPFVFRAEIAMVEVVAVVTGEDGRSVSDLTAAEFQVREDGEPRPLASVRRLTTTHSTGTTPSPAAVDGAHIERLATNIDVADAPAFVFVLDDLNTSPYDTHRVIRAAEGALRAVSGDALVAILTTSGTDGSLLTLSRPGPGHLQQIRMFRGQLLLAGPRGKGLGPQTTQSSVNAPCGVGSSVLHSQNCGDPTRPARRASTIAAAAQILGRAGSRRKALFWITPDMGVSPLDPDGNRQAQRHALVQAVNSDVAVYAVDPREGTTTRENISAPEMDMDDRPDRTTGGTFRVGPGDAVFLGKGGGVLTLESDDMVAVPLTRLARETGGQYITAANDLETVLARVVEQNSTSYLLTYESRASRVPGPHRIDVRVLRAGTRVYARRGYVVSPPAPGATSEPAATPRARILRETLQGSVSQGRLPLAVHVAPQFADGKQGRAVITVKLDDDVLNAGAIDVAVATVDEAGRVSNQQQIRMSPPPSGEPWQVTTELPLARGRHQLRVAGVSADATRTGLVLTPVEIVEPGRDLVMTPPALLDTHAGRVHPTAVRTFASGHALGVQVEVGGRAVQQKAVTVRVALRDLTGRVVREVPATLDAGAKPNRMRATAVLQTDGIAGGDYVLLSEAHTTAPVKVVRGAIPITLRGAGGGEASTEASARREPVRRVIPHAVVAYGPASRHPGAKTLVIRTGQEWGEFWKQLPTRQPLPAVDFAQVTLVAVVVETDSKSIAERPSVNRVEQDGDAAVIYWETEPLTLPLDAPTGTPLRPFIVVGLTEHVGNVRFQRIGDPK